MVFEILACTLPRVLQVAEEETEEFEVVGWDPTIRQHAKKVRGSFIAVAIDVYFPRNLAVAPSDPVCG